MTMNAVAIALLAMPIVLVGLAKMARLDTNKNRVAMNRHRLGTKMARLRGERSDRVCLYGSRRKKDKRRRGR